MSRVTKTKIIVMTMLIVIFAALVSVAIVIENKSNVIAIGDDVVLDDGIHNLPKNLVFAVADTVSEEGYFPEKSIDLTVKVTPDNATNKNIDFAIEWINPASEWASDKDLTSYLTIKKTSATTAKLTCKAPFGERAKITATSEDNNDKKATCTIDFKSRMTNCILQFETLDGTANQYGLVMDDHEGELYRIRYNSAGFNLKFVPIFTTGTTANEEFAIESAQMHLSNTFKEKFKANSTNAQTGAALISNMKINNDTTIFNDSTWIDMGTHATNSDDMKMKEAIFMCNNATGAKFAMFDLRVKFTTFSDILHYFIGFDVQMPVSNIEISNGNNVVI